MKLLLLSLILTAGAFAQFPLTYSLSSPYACPNTNVYIVTYGTWTDSTTLTNIENFVNYDLSLTPEVSLAKSLYPVGSVPSFFLTTTYQFAGQISVAASSTYGTFNSGTNLWTFNGTSAATLIDNLITASQIPTPVTTCYSPNGVGTNTYAVILLGSNVDNLSSNPDQICGYTMSGGNFIVTTVGNQYGTASQSCAGGNLTLNQVSGTVMGDTIAFVINFEATHSLEAFSWEYLGAETIMEICTGHFGTTQTAPTSYCNVAGACLYNVVTTPVVSGTRVTHYWYLQQIWVNMPPGSPTGSCSFNYTPPAQYSAIGGG